MESFYDMVPDFQLLVLLSCQSYGLAMTNLLPLPRLSMFINIPRTLYFSTLLASFFRSDCLLILQIPDQTPSLLKSPLLYTLLAFCT